MNSPRPPNQLHRISVETRPARREPIENCEHGRPVRDESGEPLECSRCPKEPQHPQSSTVAAMFTRNIASVDLLRELARRGVIEQTVDAERDLTLWTTKEGGALITLAGAKMSAGDGLTLGEALALKRLADGWRSAAILFALRKSLKAKGMVDAGWQLTERGRQVLGRT